MITTLYGIWFGIIVLLSISSVFAIKNKFIPVKLSYLFLFFLVILSVILTYISVPSLEKIGLAIPGFSDALFYLLVTLLCCMAIYLLNKYYFKLKSSNILNSSQQSVLFYILLSSPAQEFLFRSFLYYSLGLIEILNVFSMTIISSLLFGIAHIGFENKYLTYGTFMLGAVFGLAYFMVPNLILISITHAIVGLFTLSQGLLKPKFLHYI